MDGWARSLAKTPCYCSMCGRRARWAPTQDSHSLYRECPACGWFDTVTAPGERGPLPPRGGGKIIEFRRP